MQKDPARAPSTLHLYHLTPQGYLRASRSRSATIGVGLSEEPGPTGEEKLVKAPEYHTSAYLLEGLEDNYRGHGVDWPANRYLLIALSGDADVRGRKPMQTGVVNAWRCRYDLQTGKFDVPALFSGNNAKAVVPG